MRNLVRDDTGNLIRTLDGGKSLIQLVRAEIARSGGTITITGPFTGDTEAISNGLSSGDLYTLTVPNEYDIPAGNGQLVKMVV